MIWIRPQYSYLFSNLMLVMLVSYLQMRRNLAPSSSLRCKQGGLPRDPFSLVRTQNYIIYSSLDSTWDTLWIRYGMLRSAKKFLPHHQWDHIHSLEELISYIPYIPPSLFLQFFNIALCFLWLCNIELKKRVLKRTVVNLSCYFLKLPNRSSVNDAIDICQTVLSRIVLL